ncbi:D-alanyl-D-alanine carboxypeptidase [Microbacterium sp. 10M-3C3]|jgi:D-alanyl-D-alanine carboxypeptidase (penicillin-binding protein 5/6)|uniref:D-alanyl-D-alanine carboxypeptidase family protein n=1 Tax=Microbacterium sp. 10M-3C3 TaxID=2483401 RepID=UPI000F63587D|nr:D-alanyl-D-alanine carboxypeptidase [Microbacterium sp. 10M-3C3]
MTTQQDAPDATEELAGWLRDGADARAAADDPVRRARRRRSRLIAGVVVLALLVLSVGGAGGYAVWALNAPLPEPVVSLQTPQPPRTPVAAVPMPGDGAAVVAVAGADAYLGPDASAAWLRSGDDSPRPIASLTKLITTLVILDAHPLPGPDDPGPTLTFDKADHDLYDAYYVLGATVAPMPTGTRMSLRDALATMLLPSASNYADATASWAFGSTGAFAGAARRWLDAHGLASTRIVEPTGIDRRNTSTPGDLLALAKIAAADPVVAGLAGRSSMRVPGAGDLYNTNGLLGVDGITGLKTGNLGEGTFNLVYTATADVGSGTPLAVTGVMLGGPSRDAVERATREVLAGLRAGFHRVPLAQPGDRIGSVTARWGAEADIVIGASADVLTWSDTAIAVTLDTRKPTTYADGEEIGAISWTAGPDAARAPVVIAGGIEPPDAWWRLTHPDLLGGD